MTPTSSSRPNTRVTPKTKPSILKIKLSELITTSQTIAVTKEGQLIPFKRFVIGFARAPTAPPNPIKGSAGINDAIKPNKTVRITTGLPQMRCVMSRSNFPSFLSFDYEMRLPSRISSIHLNFDSPERRIPFLQSFTADSKSIRFVPSNLALIFAVTGRSPSIALTESQKEE